MRIIYLGFLIIMCTQFSCKRVGCMSDKLCVDNFDAKAKKAGDCSGCTKFGASNYCPEATEDNGECLFTRKFYSDASEAEWIDLWVAPTTDDSTAIKKLTYEGRIVHFPKVIPECEIIDSTITVLRKPGEYYYEIETKSGKRAWGWVIYREEGCRLLDVY